MEDIQYPHRHENNDKSEELKAKTAAFTLQDAKEFACAPNEDLSFWCLMADCPPALVIESANKILQGAVDIKKVRQDLRRLERAKPAIQAEEDEDEDV